MNSLCRVCIDKAIKCTSLNNKIENPSSPSLLDFLNKYMSLNACETDKLPQSLCSICTHSIKTFYTFVKLAEKSDKILREALTNSISTGRHNDNGVVSSEETIIRSEKIEEELEDFNKEDSFHCQTRENSTEPSLYILDIVKEEPRVSESTLTADFKDAEINESDKFPFNLDHSEGSVKEPDDILSCIDDDLASIDVENIDSDYEVPISLLKRRLIKNKDETDSQSNFLSKSGEATDDSLKSHIHGYTENTYKCIEGVMFFNNREEFRTHCRNHINETKHECNICGKKFDRYGYLYKHLTVHEEKKKYKCSICEKSFKHHASRWKHMKMHNGEKHDKKHECEICRKKFSSRYSLNIHLENHKGIKKKCDQCGKEYKNHDTLRRHKKTHIYPKPFKCEICSTKFRTKLSLNNHMKNHNRITKKCDQCDKVFKNNNTLRIHMKCHLNSKPFKCGNCEKTFSKKDKHTNCSVKAPNTD